MGMHRRHHVRAVIDQDVRFVVERGVDMSVVGLVVFALDGEDWNPFVHQSRRHIILCRKRIAGAENGIGATGLERQRQIRGLGRDMGADEHADAVEAVSPQRTGRESEPAPASRARPTRSGVALRGERRILDVERHLFRTHAKVNLSLLKTPGTPYRISYLGEHRTRLRMR